MISENKYLRKRIYKGKLENKSEPGKPPSLSIIYLYKINVLLYLINQSINSITATVGYPNSIHS